MKKSKSLVLLFIYLACAGLVFDSQLAMVILNEVKGFHTGYIGILEVILLVATLVLEIPSGFVSDYFGYRNTLILSRIFILLYSTSMLFMENYVGITLGFICYGISEAFKSGTQEVYIYKFLHKEEDLIKANVVIANIGTVSGMVAVLVGGWAASITWTGVYVLGIIMQIISLGILFLISDDRKMEKKASHHSVIKEIITVCGNIRVLYRSKCFILVSVSACLCDSIYSIIMIFYPLILRKYGYSFIGIAAGSTAAVILGLVCLLLLKRAKNNPISPFLIIMILRILLGIATCSAALLQLPIYSLLVVMLINALVNIYFPFDLTGLNEYIPSAIRSTANSLTNALQTVLMCVLTPIYTYYLAGDNFTFAVFMIPSVIYLFSAILLGPVLYSKYRKKPIDT